MKYAIRRILMLLLTMLIVSFLTFLAFELVSGDPAQTMLGTEATAEQLAALRHELGLDQPFFLRYFRWLGGFFTGDLGTSYMYRNQGVWGLIAPKLGVTLVLALVSFVLIRLSSTGRPPRPQRSRPSRTICSNVTSPLSVYCRRSRMPKSEKVSSTS